MRDLLGHATAVARLLGVDGPVRLGDAPGRVPSDAASAWRSLAAATPPGGAVVVPCAVLPGQRPLAAVREMAAWHAARTGLSLDEAAGELAALAGVAGAEPLWEGWLRWVVERPHLLRDDGAPALLVDWVARAAEAGLGYLCDAWFPHTGRARLSPEVRAVVEAEVEAWGDRVRGEQLADFVHGAHRRHPILVRGPSLPELAFDPVAWGGLGLRAVDDEAPALLLHPPRSVAAVLADADTPAAARQLLAELAAGPRRFVELADRVDDAATGAFALLELGAVELFEASRPPGSDQPPAGVA